MDTKHTLCTWGVHYNFFAVNLITKIIKRKLSTPSVLGVCTKNFS